MSLFPCSFVLGALLYCHCLEKYFVKSPLPFVSCAIVSEIVGSVLVYLDIFFAPLPFTVTGARAHGVGLVLSYLVIVLTPNSPSFFQGPG